MNAAHIDAYVTILQNPQEHGLPFLPVTDYFEPCEEGTSTHIVFEEFSKIYPRQVPKVIFYVIMNKHFSQHIDGENYTLRIKEEFKNQ